MFQYVKVYSIDIALGAVISTWFLARVLLINLPWHILLVLGLTVWSIYTVDHLIDAYKLKTLTGPNRYFYHKKYFRPVLGFVIFTVVCTGILTYFMLPEPLIVNGLIIGGSVVIYFLARLILGRYFSGIKEILAAAIFTMGVALPAYHYADQVNFFFITVVLQFFCIVFANLLICSVWDEKIDRQNSFDSMTVTFGIKFINFLIFSLVIIALSVSVAGFFLYEAHFLKVQLMLLFMSLALIIIYQYGGKAGEHVQRFLIDSIFFIPLLMLVL